MTQLHSRKAFLAPKLRQIVLFLRWQGITMAGNLFYGFLCVRLLPIPEYAKFAVVFGFLGPLAVLMNIGFSNTLLPLIGERIDDRQLIADYVASLRQLAHWLYFVIAPAAVIVYPLLVHRQHWGWRTIAVMLAMLLVAAWCSRVAGAYGAVLIVRRDRASWYRAQMVSSFGTLALLGVVWATHLLNAFSAIFLNVAGIVYVATAYYLRAQRLLRVNGNPSPEMRKAIVHLSLPSMPNAIFYALQGQVSLLLITVFGHLTAVASVGALSRLGQIFVLLAQMNPLLVEPYFAKLPQARLKRNYLGLLAVEGAFCFLASGLAASFPQVYLWILGPKYSHLRTEVFLLVAACSMSHLSGVLWIVNGSRRFVYWWNGMAVIVFTLAIEALFIWKFDLSTVYGVLLLNLVTVAGALAVNLLTGVFGFIQGPRGAVLHQVTVP